MGNHRLTEPFGKVYDNGTIVASVSLIGFVMDKSLGGVFTNRCCRLVTAFVFGWLACHVLVAEDTSCAGADRSVCVIARPVIAEKPRDGSGYASLAIEYEAALERYYQAVRSATMEGVSKEAKEIRHPRAIFTARFLKLADTKPNRSDAFSSLAWVVNHADPEKETQYYQRAVELLLRDHIASERLMECAEALTLGGGSGPALGLSENLLRGLIARSPHERVRCVARLALGQGLIYQSTFVATIKAASDEKLCDLVEISTPEFIAAMREKDAARLKREGVQLLERVVENGGNWKITYANETHAIGKIAAQQLYALKKIRTGAKAPELTCVGMDGNPVRLSNLRGKLVVLKIWATWCVPCRRDFPHLRALEKRWKDKSFALVLVSIDHDLETLVNRLADEDVPGWQWHGGPHGEINNWYVDGISRVFVIDEEGVFRGIDVAGEELDRLIEAHLPGED